MLTIAIMCLGVLVGATVFPSRLKAWNTRLQTAATALLIFTMGVGLGSRPDFLSEMGEMGLESLVLAAAPAALSVAVVYPLSRRFLAGPARQDAPGAPDAQEEADRWPF